MDEGGNRDGRKKVGEKSVSVKEGKSASKGARKREKVAVGNGAAQERSWRIPKKKR